MADPYYLGGKIGEVLAEARGHAAKTLDGQRHINNIAVSGNHLQRKAFNT